MGVFLPSETGRLVLSYLLDQGYEETRERFMSECGAIAELRDLDREDLEFACKVNNRSLTELLKEYNRFLLHIITTNVESFQLNSFCSLGYQIRKLARDVSSDKVDNFLFEHPLRILKIVGEIWKSNKSTLWTFKIVLAVRLENSTLLKMHKKYFKSN